MSTLQGETICQSLTDSTLFCSTGGVCLAVTSTAPLVIPTPPTIALVGQALLTLPQGTAYALCPTPTPTSAICDRGATASDSLDGDLTSLIEACDTSGARSALPSHSMLQLSHTGTLHLGRPDQASTCHSWAATSFQNCF